MHNVDTLNICMKKFDTIKSYFDKITSFFFFTFYTLFFKRGFVCAQIVHMRGNRLVPQFLLKQSDTLHTQYTLDCSFLY